MNQTPEEILATIGYTGFVASLYNRTGDISKDFAHAVLGVVTEMHELSEATDPLNEIEELGDLAFYVEAMLIVLNDMAPLSRFLRYSDIEAAQKRLATRDAMSTATVEWLDLAKRWVGYGKAPTMSVYELAIEMVALRETVFMSFVGTHGPDMYNQAVITNVKKLMKRYNGIKFDAERAVNRDVVAEREVMEKSLN